MYGQWKHWNQSRAYEKVLLFVTTFFKMNMTSSSPPLLAATSPVFSDLLFFSLVLPSVTSISRDALSSSSSRSPLFSSNDVMFSTCDVTPESTSGSSGLPVSVTTYTTSCCLFSLSVLEALSLGVG